LYYADLGIGKKKKAIAERFFKRRLVGLMAGAMIWFGKQKGS
jgi:hypothetical protein